ncbi:Acyl-protein thioesterase 1 [Zancudomyces culisetae]|uniref:Acyl-protein thioesterase 1 n=1 Tax=Zancudomyces culisetae TaxID=1213189 RepID=A0A1R1PH13_ZANCU|nr:Acyl-protein thioesterase 1 [Zancudomyces culisetae]OMH80264.1 Acyl-protein thioesterase 1 [Zancudomyces culisetae]|eukprot:OMH80061.1 Acyl-protein thioesterase 1 [Zancudomyces culisetae]
MLRAVIRPPTKKHTATVIFLHGLGDSGHGWSSIADSLSSSLPHVKFIFPHAPSIPITLNFGMSMPGWYDIFSLENLDKHDEKGLLNSVSQVNSLISQEINQHGISASRIVLGGFSQGAAMSYLTGVTSELKLGGIIALSGYLPLGNKISTMVTETSKAVPIFAGHGTADPVVRYEYGTKSVDALKKLGYNVDFKSYRGMEHSSCQQELVDIAQFLAKTIPDA